MPSETCTRLENAICSECLRELFRKHWGKAWVKFKESIESMAKNSNGRCPMTTMHIMASNSPFQGFFDYKSGIPPWCEYSAEQAVSRRLR